MDTIGWAGIHDTCTDLCLELGIVKEGVSFPDKGNWFGPGLNWGLRLVYEEGDHTDLDKHMSRNVYKICRLCLAENFGVVFQGYIGCGRETWVVSRP